MRQQLWEFVAWRPYSISDAEFYSAVNVLNEDEVFNTAMSNGERRTSPSPNIRMRINSLSSKLDCFTCLGRYFVSASFRDAVSDYSECLEYSDVQIETSDGMIMDQDYQLMSVCVTDVAHHQTSGARISDYDVSSFIYKSSDINVHKTDCKDIFFDEVFRGSIFCSDRFALALLSNSCTGIRFVDPSSKAFDRPLRFRTLRGMEEEGDWDQVRQVEQTKLIDSF